MEPLSFNWLLYLVALHDVGKADPLFQNRDSTLANDLRDMGIDLPDEGSAFRHEARSAKWTLLHLKQRHRWKEQDAGVVASALRGHHGNFSAQENGEEVDCEERFAAWTVLRDDLANLIAHVLDIGNHPATLEPFPNASVAGAKLAAIIVVCDWIASNPEVFQYPCLNSNDSPGQYWKQACDEAKAAISRLDLDIISQQTETEFPRSFEKVWPECSTLRPSQTAMEDVCSDGVRPGLAIIEAPTGEGKTEAAIYLAEYWSSLLRRSGAYIALPTMATSNQMYSRYSAFLNRYRPEAIGPKLVHGMAWLMDDACPGNRFQTYGEYPDEENNEASGWFSNSRRALLAPEAVGTIDQALMAVLNVKFGFLRLLGLTSKILIIDEVHACDAYMNVLLVRLLEWCGALKVPVIMLSATLSAKQKRMLIKAYRADAQLPGSQEDEPYPLLTFVPLDSEPLLKPVCMPQDSRTIRLIQHPVQLDNLAATADLAAQQVASGGCACVLVNTVKDAQRLFCILKERKIPDTDIYLFHSRFRAERRMEIEDSVTVLFGVKGIPARPKKAILVSTQVVEQSLDLDFDVMISQIAPVDLLLQRCGRLWRHERKSRPGSEPVIHILLPNEESFDFGASEKVYDRELLLRTLALLQNREVFALPADYRKLVEGCYGDLPLPKDSLPEEILKKAHENRCLRMAEDEDKAGTHLISQPNDNVFQLAQMSRPVSEDGDEERSSYFHAQTRLGDETFSVIVLHDPELVQASLMKTAPSRDVLKRLFKQKANVPGWWLSDVVADDGFQRPFPGSGWLRGNLVLAMKDGKWRGERNGSSIVIRDDNCLGLYLNDE